MSARSTTAPPRRTASPARRSSCSSTSPRSRPATSPTTTVSDEPITINGWSPRNNSRNFAGDVTLREAFARSINTVSVRLAQEVGFRTVADMAQRFGITTPVVTHPVDGAGQLRGAADRHDPRLRRGRARRAIAVVPYGIKRVTTADGELLYQHEPDDSRVLVAP